MFAVFNLHAKTKHFRRLNARFVFNRDFCFRRESKTVMNVYQFRFSSG